MSLHLKKESPNYISYGVDYCSDSRERIEFNDVIQYICDTNDSCMWNNFPKS